MTRTGTRRDILHVLLINLRLFLLWIKENAAFNGCLAKTQTTLWQVISHKNINADGCFCGL